MKIKIKNLKSFYNKTGSLVPIQINNFFKNFRVKRIFYIYGKKKYTRANHAHKKCEQIYIPIYGTSIVKVIQKKFKKNFIISSKNKKMLFIPTYTWTSIKFLSNKSILLVLCNYKFDRREYIEDIKAIL